MTRLHVADGLSAQKVQRKAVEVLRLGGEDAVDRDDARLEALRLDEGLEVRLVGVLVHVHRHHDRSMSHKRRERAPGPPHGEGLQRHQTVHSRCEEEKEGERDGEHGGDVNASSAVVVD